uniref:EOG090X0KP6 n=1 Tax=Evadne anonyx TaxID=141404 RepID=A0A9N6WQS4_9CRUS|nr:EOG090X0KP6 [Evadne anonyx]
MYDTLINLPSNDWDIFYWATGVRETPTEFDNEIMNMLKEHVKNKDREARLKQPDLSVVEPTASSSQDCTEQGNTSAETIDSGSNENQDKLTAFQKAKIERNRQRALLLREARLQAHPYKRTDTVGNSVVIIQNSKLIDTGGGFLIDENDLNEEQSKPVNIVQDPAPILIPERPHCLLCQEPLHDSFLFRSFSYAVCDSCRDDDEKHQLITRTDAKQEYLLKDCDLDMREPILRFILRKNPHNPRWGDMKLYLHLQVKKRALEVWETMEKIEEQHNLREDKRKKTKVKKFNKEVKALRMAVRSSVYIKQTASHEHVFGAEVFDEEKDFYYRSCGTCDYKQVYEKM